MKQPSKKYFLANKGFSSITAAIILATISMLSVVAFSVHMTSSKIMIDELQSQKALDIARAGLQYAAAQLMGDANWADNAAMSGDFADGSFVVSFTSQAQKTATLQSAGTIGGITRTISQQLEFSGGAPTAMEHAIYTEGNVVTSGSSSGVVIGSVAAAGDVDSEGGVTFDGTISEYDDSVSLPTPDWNYWYNNADYVISGNYTFPGGNYTGIYYITGNVRFSNNVTIKGTIVARGEVRANNNSGLSIAADMPNPAVLAEGLIIFNGSRNVSITGWVYSAATTTFTGNSDVALDGGVGSVGNVTFTGNTDVHIDYNPEINMDLPGFTGGDSAAEEITFSSWQEVY